MTSLKHSLLLALLLAFVVLILYRPITKSEYEISADWGPLPTPRLRHRLNFDEPIPASKREELISTYRATHLGQTKPNGVLYFLVRPNNYGELHHTIIKLHTVLNHASKYPVIFFTERSDFNDHPVDVMAMQSNLISTLSYENHSGVCSFALECRIAPGYEYQGPYSDTDLPRVFPWDSPMCKRIVLQDSCLPWPVIFAETVFNFPASATPQEVKEYSSYTADDVGFNPVRVGYRHMCRFMTFVQNHPLMAAFDWYWRVDDDSLFLSRMPYDPLELLAAMDKTFGWTVMEMENGNYARTFVDAVLVYRQRLLERGEQLGVDFYDAPYEGNFPIFFNNFEIGKLSFWRDPRVREYLAYIDDSHGTYKHRWGDAPIRSGAVSLFLSADQVHFFADIEYAHDPDMRQFGHHNMRETSIERRFWRWVMAHDLSFSLISPVVIAMAMAGVLLILADTLRDYLHGRTASAPGAAVSEGYRAVPLSPVSPASHPSPSSPASAAADAGADVDALSDMEGGSSAALMAAGNVPSARRGRAADAMMGAHAHSPAASSPSLARTTTPAVVRRLALCAMWGVFAKRVIDLVPVVADEARISLLLSDSLSFAVPTLALVTGYAFYQQVHTDGQLQHQHALQYLCAVALTGVLCECVAMRIGYDASLRELLQRVIATHSFPLWLLLGPIMVLRLTTIAYEAHATVDYLPPASFLASLLSPSAGASDQAQVCSLSSTGQWTCAVPIAPSSSTIHSSSSSSSSSSGSPALLYAWAPLIATSSLFIAVFISQVQLTVALSAFFVCGWSLALWYDSPTSTVYPPYVLTLVGVYTYLRNAAQRHRVGVLLLLGAQALGGVMASQYKACIETGYKHFFLTFPALAVMLSFSLFTHPTPVKKTLFSSSLSCHVLGIVLLQPVAVMLVTYLLAPYPLSHFAVLLCTPASALAITAMLSWLFCRVLAVELLTPFAAVRPEAE